MQHFLVLVAGDGHALLRRNWLGKIRLNWAQIAYTSTPVPSLQALCDKYKEVFADKLGTMKQIHEQLRGRIQSLLLSSEQLETAT